MDGGSDMCWVPMDDEEAVETVEECEMDMDIASLALPMAAAAPAAAMAAPAAAAPRMADAAAAVPQHPRHRLAAPRRLHAAPGRLGARVGAVPRSRQRSARRRATAADTNVMSIKLGTLADDVALATGAPTQCGGCRAYLSVVSRVLDHVGKVIRRGGPYTAPAGPEAAAADEAKTEGKAEEAGAELGRALAALATVPRLTEGQLLWTCEFCGHHNVIECDEDELPGDESMDYVLEAAPAPAATAAATAGDGKGASGDADDGIIVFAIDTSGSMCVTTEIAGRVELKGDRSQSLRNLATPGDAANQWFPGQRRDVTYVSRLQSVMAAVTSQIEALKREHPTKKVALVSFSNEVVIVGDGSQAPRHLAGTRLENFEQLVEGANYALTGAVKDTADTLVKKVHALEEGGSTALGPALLVSIMIASRKRGSRVVMCTDGLANVGLGAMDDASDAAANAAEEFYRRLGLLAVEHGVVVDVVGIEGEGCDVETLTLAVEPSGGAITKVQPADVTRNFASMLANKAVATNVSATMFLHKALAFRSTLDDDVALGKNRVMRHLGNVAKDTETTFEYGAMSPAERRAARITALPSSMPFQVQIHFTRLSGMKCVRVIAQAKAVTRDRAAAERRAHTKVLASHAAQQAARLARRGSYDASRLNMRGYQQVLNRVAKATSRSADVATAAAYGQHMAELDGNLRLEMAKESADCMSFTDSADRAATKKKRSRRRKGNDKLSKAIFGGMRTNLATWSSASPRPAAAPAPVATAAPAPTRPAPVATRRSHRMPRRAARTRAAPAQSSLLGAVSKSVRRAFGGSA